jgi:menaquinol-cytochrome c reductase iron-sulfur subunit
MTAPAGSLRPGDEKVSTTKETGMTRRVMLFKFGLLFNGLVAAALATPILRYVLAPVIGERKTGYESWLSLGSLEQFPAGQTRLTTFRNPVVTASDGETADIPCWVRNVDGQNFQVFAINCAHLGCPVRWFPQSNLFMCPCHGGAYYQDGSRASGPPERGLFEYSHKIEDGKLLIKAGEMPTPGRAANTAGGESRCV